MPAELPGAARTWRSADDRLGTDNPQIRYFLGLEWMAHKELDRAAAELKAAEGSAPRDGGEALLRYQ